MKNTSYLCAILQIFISVLFSVLNTYLYKKELFVFYFLILIRDYIVSLLSTLNNIYIENASYNEGNKGSVEQRKRQIKEA